MTLLWAILAGMTLVGAAILIVPVLRHQSKADVSGELVNSLVFKDRLKELDAEREGQFITEEQYQQLKQELELTLLKDVQDSQPDLTAKSSAGKWVAWILIIIVPIAGGIIYLSEGYRPELSEWFQQQEKMQRVMPLMMSGNFEAAEKEGVNIGDFIRNIQIHLQQNPDDAQSWYLLGVSYLQVEVAKQSELAFSRALNIEPDNIDYLMGHTQASLAMNNGQLTPKIHQTLLQVIQQQPQNPKPYMTWGMALFQQRDFQGAINIWQQYLQRPDADQRAVKLLQRSIDVAKAGLEQPVQADQTGQALHQQKPELSVTVKVSDTIKTQLSPTDTLFVYAKATNGPPMPLAVVRQTVAQWPVTAQLNDSTAMTPDMALSKFEKVVVQARISPSGNAIPQSGDWIGPTKVISLKPGQQAVELEINSAMP